MPHTLPDCTTGRKPAGPGAHPRDERAEYHAAAGSAINFDGNRIASAIAELSELIQLFLDDHGPDGFAQAIVATGLPATRRPGWGEMGQQLVTDARALLWVLETCGGTFEANLLPLPEPASAEVRRHG